MNCKLFFLSILVVSSSLLHSQAIKEKKNTKKTDDPAIYLNFENATLSSVVDFLGKQKNINIVPNKTLETIKVSYSTQTPLTLENAWSALLTMLESNQLSIIEKNGTYCVVPSNTAKTQSLPIFIRSAEELPANDTMVRYMYSFKNIKPDNVRTILDQMLTPNSVHYNNNLNVCLITEKGINIKMVMQIIKELDSGGLREAIKIIHLKEANAESIAEFINKNLIGSQNDSQNLRLMQPPGKQETSYFSKNIKVIPDTYNNSLILLGTESGLQRIIDFIQKELDNPLVSNQSRLHIKELKYVDAEKLKPILEAVTLPPTRDSKSPIVGQVKYFEDMIIAAESSTEQKDDKTINIGSGNRLLIACNKDDWGRIEPFIDKLDKPQPQVAMEILFVSVQTIGNKQLGAQLTTKRLNQLGKNVNAQTLHLAPLSPANEPQNEMLAFGSFPQAGGAFTPNTTVLTSGSTFLTAGAYPTLWAIAQATFAGSTTNTLSQPYLVASNHEKCTFEFTEQRVLTDRIDSSSTTAVLKNTNLPATTSVEIIPTINTDGLITLSVVLKLDSFLSGYTNNDPVTSGARATNHVTTRATIADGEVLAIGGILRTSLTEAVYKTPILGDIPFIGNLFRSRTQTLNPNNLNVFIRPTLIKPSFESGSDDYTQLKLDYSKIQIDRQSDLVSNNDPVQRWFFKGGQKTEDFEQIDNFTDGKYQPSSVMIPIDPYYKTETSRTINRLAQHRKKLLAKEKEKTSTQKSKT